MEAGCIEFVSAVGVKQAIGSNHMRTFVRYMSEQTMNELIGLEAEGTLPMFVRMSIGNG